MFELTANKAAGDFFIGFITRSAKAAKCGQQQNNEIRFVLRSAERTQGTVESEKLFLEANAPAHSRLTVSRSRNHIPFRNT